jgi:hypothetical protein
MSKARKVTVSGRAAQVVFEMSVPGTCDRGMATDQRRRSQEMLHQHKRQESDARIGDLIYPKLRQGVPLWGAGADDVAAASDLAEIKTFGHLPTVTSFYGLSPNPLKSLRQVDGALPRNRLAAVPLLTFIAFGQTPERNSSNVVFPHSGVGVRMGLIQKQSCA